MRKARYFFQISSVLFSLDFFLRRFCYLRAWYMLAKTVQVPGVDISQHTSLFYSVRQTRFDIESRVSLLVCFSKNLSQCHWKFKRVVWYFFYQVFIGINLIFFHFSCVSAKNFNKHTRQQIWETVLRMKY